MRTQLKLFVVMCLIVMLGAVGCNSAGNQPAPTAVPTSEPELAPTEMPTAVPEPIVDPATAVVLNMVERVNAEDYAGAAEFVAEDMMAYFIGLPPTGMEIYRGKAQFQTFLEECCTGANFVWEVTPNSRVEDGVVTAMSKTWMDFTRELGVAPNNWYEIFVVEDGKITQYVSWITQESLAKFKPVLREVAPELFEFSLPTDETPVNEVTITFADGTCAYNGPMTLEAGNVVVNIDVQDQDKEKYAVAFFTLDAEKDLVDFMAAGHGYSVPSWSVTKSFSGELNPGVSTTYSLPVDEGLYYMVCMSKPPDIFIGNAGPFVVVK